MFMQSCCLLATSFTYISQPVVDMRGRSDSNSSLVSQTQYAEHVDVIKKESDWSYIKTPDQYKGWIPSNAYVERPNSYETTTKTIRLSAHIYKGMTTKRDYLMTVPLGTALREIDKSDPRWTQIELPDGRLAYIQKGDITPLFNIKRKGDLAAFSKQFLGLPFTWGGRTSFGYDCSGFVQMLYMQIGIQLERDTGLQILDPQLEDIDLDQLEPGDLIFFGKSRSKIRHVGMYTGQDEFIHTGPYQNKPWIQTSNLDEYLRTKYAFALAKRLRQTCNN